MIAQIPGSLASNGEQQPTAPAGEHLNATCAARRHGGRCKISYSVSIEVKTSRDGLSKEVALTLAFPSEQHAAIRPTEHHDSPLGI
jgi:hypothetical protein